MTLGFVDYYKENYSKNTEFEEKIKEFKSELEVWNQFEEVILNGTLTPKLFNSSNDEL